jgi:hypothetical protein
MLHACVERFDVMGVRGNILGWDREVNKALYLLACAGCCIHVQTSANQRQEPDIASMVAKGDSELASAVELQAGPSAPVKKY